MFKNKKGMELSMNAIVIAIIVIVVLVIVIAFFIGGTAGVAGKIREIFGGAIAGTDTQLAKQFCQEYCDQGRETAFCKKTFKVDDDADASTLPIDMKCSADSTATIGLDKQDVTRDLGINCLTIRCKT